MPLSEVEQRGIESLLRLLPNDDLLSLQTTVTNGIVQTADVSETIKSIISYTNHPADLLRRKKVKKDVILKYLDKNKIYVERSKQDKRYVAEEVLRFWGSSMLEVMEIEEEDLVTIYNASDASGSRSQGSSSLLTHSSGGSSLISSSSTTPVLGPAFGEQFTTWFYRMLNRKHPNFVPPPAEQESQNNGSGGAVNDFSVSHFYPDCSLTVVKVSDDRQEVSECFSAEQVFLTLVSLVIGHGLVFNVNGSGVMEETHGLKVVTAHGTLHQTGGLCVGLFDQHFQLVKDPFQENNWVIKASRLMLKQKDNANHRQITL